MRGSCRTHPEELGLQQTLQHLVAAFPLGVLLQDALQEHPDLSDLGICWQQVDGLGGNKTTHVLDAVAWTFLPVFLQKPEGGNLRITQTW